MAYKYTWKNKEANFGKPMRQQVKGGTHVTFELILKYNNKYISLRRASIPGHEPRLSKQKKNLLYFCHGLIRYGESVEKCVQRIIKEQCGVKVKSFKVVYIDSEVQKKDDQWAITPHMIVELASKPKPGKYGNQITEVVEFGKGKVRLDFAWWSKRELQKFLAKFDK